MVIRLKKVPRDRVTVGKSPQDSNMIYWAEEQQIYLLPKKYIGDICMKHM